MTANSVIKVMIVDDHPLVRVGMATVVNQQSDMMIAAESDGRSAHAGTLPAAPA
jgi:DNA-binding NarL/FixJ family response regulator